MVENKDGQKMVRMPENGKLQTVEKYVQSMCGTIVAHITKRVESLMPANTVTVVNEDSSMLPGTG